MCARAHTRTRTRTRTPTNTHAHEHARAHTSAQDVSRRRHIIDDVEEAACWDRELSADAQSQGGHDIHLTGHPSLQVRLEAHDLSPFRESLPPQAQRPARESGEDRLQGVDSVVGLCASPELPPVVLRGHELSGLQDMRCLFYHGARYV